MQDTSRAPLRLEWDSKRELVTATISRPGEASPLVSTVSKVRSLSHSLGITDADIAFAFGVRARSVQRWWSGESRPSYERERRLLEFAYVLDELQKVLKPDAARDWLMTPNRELDHDSPAERVARGDYRRVLELVDAMADGVFV